MAERAEGGLVEDALEAFVAPGGPPQEAGLPDWCRTGAMPPAEANASAERKREGPVSPEEGDIFRRWRERGPVPDEL